jgi:hypothetical protein
VLALLGRVQENEVSAIDCNARAVHFSRFNMHLNGLSSVDFRVADFLQPREARTFDLVLCNPPFVISPRSDRLHSDSGQPGDDLCRLLLRAAPQWLATGGHFQMVVNWAQQTGQDWRERLAGWCRGTGCDALLVYSHLQDAAEYALDRLQEAGLPPGEQAVEFERWMVYYREQEIEAIGFGLITLRRTDARATWFHHYQFRPGEKPGSATVRQAFARQDFLRAHTADALLLKARMRRAEDLVQQQKHAWSAGGWKLIDARLGRLGGPAPTALPARVVDLIVWCDGTRPVGEYLAARAPGAEHPRAAEFAAAVRQLVELGLLEPVHPATRDAAPPLQ